jgi:phage gp36-like protein
MALSVADFLARIDERYIGELVGTVTGGAVDQARVQRALDDARAELDGYIPRLPVAHRPSETTLGVHQAKVAMYLLTLDRPGKEFEQIRNAYTDTIAFYATQIEGAAAGTAGGSPIDGVAESPDPVFTDAAFRGFT